MLVFLVSALNELRVSSVELEVLLSVGILWNRLSVVGIATFSPAIA